MRVLHGALLLLISSLNPVSGLREAHVGVLDFHLPLLGAPLTDFARTAPAFHIPSPSALSSPSDTTRKRTELVYTASVGNVLAAIHSGNGTLAWRYAFAGGADQLISFFQHDDYIAALSGPGGATLRLFEASTGHLISETHLHAPEAGKLHAPDRGASVSFLPSSEGSASTSPDLIVLTNGYEIRRLSSTGELKWAWTAEDHGAQILYTHLTATDEAIYSVGISKSFSSLQLFFLSLHPDTGAVQSTTPIPSAISDGVSDVIQLNHPETGPVLVWLEEGIIRNAGFVPQGLWSKPTAVKVGIFDRIVDVGLGRSHGIFLGITRSDGAARVIHLTANRNIISEHEFADSKISEDYAESQYVGGVDQLGRPYIARVYWSHVHKLINVHVYGPTLAGGQGVLSGFTVPFDTSRGGIISAAAIAVTGPADDEGEKEVVLDATVLVSTSTGAMQMWSPKRKLWTREEGLGEATVRLVVDYPEEQIPSTTTIQEEYNTTFVERLQRHITQLANLPTYLNTWARQFLAPSGAASLTTNTNGTSSMTIRDITGARKIILLATPYGGIYALDSSTGKIMWQKLLGLASGFGASESSSANAQVVPRKLIQLTTHDGKPNGVVLVALRKEAPSPQDPRGAMENFVFHFDERTGDSRLPSLNKPNIAVLRDAGIEDSDEPEEPAPLLEGIRIGTPGAGIVDSFSITLNKRNVVLLVDEYQLAHLYPHTPENVAAFSKAGPEMFFPLRIGPLYGRKLGGYSFMARPLTPPDAEEAGAFSASLSAFRAYQAWTFSPPSGVDILSHTLVQHPKDRPLASWGKALGNRTTLYKYATGRMLGLVLSGPGRGERPPSCEVAVLDGASGAVLYRRALPVAGGIVGTCDVKIAFAENWLVYTYFDPADDVARPINGARGYRVVSVEMYEGGADRRTESAGLSAKERKSAEVATVEQAFVWGSEVGAMGMSETKFGISSKAVILAGTNGQIVTLSRRMLDPRRPKRKVTAEEAEEGLVPYDAILPDDGPRVLSHRYNVLRINKIESSPAKLESTAVVCAFGLDIFCSRIAPSGTFDVLSEEFNKAQLVLTVLGLLGGIMVASPIVRRKTLRERWYA